MKLENFSHPLLIAHRGFRSKYPENTLAAFEAALDLGARMIELDVTLSRDRQLVVIHDDQLERTTNGKGAVKEHSLQELKRLDAGSWFNPDFAGEPIPTLEEALNLINNRALVNIEIKSSAYESHQPPDSAEKQVLQLVQQKNMVNAVLVSSFEPGILQNMTALKDIPAIAFLSRKPADKSTVEFCRKLGVFSWNPWHEIVTAEQVELMHKNGFRVFAFTVNTAKEFQQLTRLGVDGVVTDDIPCLRHQELY